MTLLALLLAVAVILFSVMYATKRSDLGFISAVFWFLAGTQAYTLRTEPLWESIYYYIFWVCSIGLTIFCIQSAMGMRRESTDIPDDVDKVREGTEPETVNEGASVNVSVSQRRSNQRQENIASKRKGVNRDPYGTEG